MKDKDQKLETTNSQSKFQRWVKWLITPKCKHVWKTKEVDYLYSTSDMWNAGASIEIDYRDIYAHKQTCLLCEASRIAKRGELVPYPKTKAI